VDIGKSYCTGAVLTGLVVGYGSVLRLGKYFSIVVRLGGLVISETRIIKSAEPRTIGTTGRKP
jgi:hypothetical protein